MDIWKKLRNKNRRKNKFSFTIQS